MEEYFRLEDFNLKDKTITVRADLNLPYNPETEELSENPRLYKHVETIKKLQEFRAKIVVLAHQGRKGKSDFISLEKHAELLKKYLGNVKFIKFGESFDYIEKIREGEVVLLDNVRFYEDETADKSIEEHANSELVKKLSPLIDYFILDAFSVAHRCHASVVGFATLKPSLPGPVFETEQTELKKFLKEVETSKNNIFILGGAKLEEPLEIIDNFLDKEVKILTTGVLSLLFLISRGYKLGEATENFLKEKGYLNFLTKIEKLKNNEKIITPPDVAVERDGNRIEISAENLPTKERILDIGPKTIEFYREIIKNSTNVFMKGPAGIYERKNFEYGTKKLFEILKNFNSVLAGGNTMDALIKLKIPFDRFNYVSLGGGAAIKYLTGKELPGIKALKQSFEKFKSIS